MSYFFRVAIVLSIFALYGLAQQPSASLTGIITDQAGAVIPGATVTATNKATNLSRSATTNDEGLYVISNLPVGKYIVKVGASGFETKTSADEITLSVGQLVRLDGELAVGKITDTVDLIGDM